MGYGLRMGLYVHPVSMFSRERFSGFRDSMLSLSSLCVQSRVVHQQHGERNFHSFYQVDNQLIDNREII